MGVGSSIDVAVIGAGPAGATAGRLLAKAGLRVTLFEKSAWPRAKVCGGGLLGRVLAEFPPLPDDIVEHVCGAAELVHHQPNLHYLVRHPQPVVTMVMRERLDAFLVEQAIGAGAEFRCGCPVSALELTPEAASLQTPEGPCIARYLVACDGAHGVVASALRLPPLAPVAAALEGEAWFGAEVTERFQGSARFDFGCVPGGYGWIFPKRDHLSVGVLTTRRGDVNLREEYERYCQKVGLPRPVRESRRGHVIPLRPRRGMFAHSRVLWAGDAAGLVDPVFAEGITGAVKSGRLAAVAIAENFHAPERANAAYKAQLERELLPDLRVARWLSTILYRMPWVRKFALAHQGERLTHFALQVAAGETNYRQLFARGTKSLVR